MNPSRLIVRPLERITHNRYGEIINVYAAWKWPALGAMLAVLASALENR